MGDVIVKYDGNAINPTPLVNRDVSFIDYGPRYGSVNNITLNGFLTGIASGVSTAISTITNLFTGQFKTLEVFEDTTSIHKWNNVSLEEISFSPSTFSIGAFAPYSVKLVSYDVPSGVIDPSNEYSFTQNQDGTVDVAHRISAKGIKTSNGAFNNAVSFVKLFTGKNPYTNCLPTFIPSGYGVMTNISESIDRLNCVYSVSETYKYNTGSSQSYIQTTTVSTNDTKTADYTTIDLELKWQGSTINSSIGALDPLMTGYDLNTILTSYGIDTSNTYKNSFSVNRDSGSNVLEVKVGYLSGISNDYSGYFDYSVSNESDLINKKTTWKINGEFICKGPIVFRRGRLLNFKNANGGSSYLPYLKGLIENSALFSNYGGYSLRSVPLSLSAAENTGMATLKLSASFDDNDTYGGFINPKYNISVEPSIWVYKSIPSANIEGHYTIQDLQMRKQAKMHITFEGEVVPVNDLAMSSGYSIINAVSGLYVGANSFLTTDNASSGIENISIETESLGNEAMSTDISLTKVYGSIIGDDYRRYAGFKWGY